MRKTFLALPNRNFRLFFVGQLISNTGNWLTNVALTLLVLKITGSGLGVGILASFQFGPILLLSAWAGAIADRSAVDASSYVAVLACLLLMRPAELRRRPPEPRARRSFWSGWRAFST
jgi:hypothetical protein